MAIDPDRTPIRAQPRKLAAGELPGRSNRPHRHLIAREPPLQVRPHLPVADQAHRGAALRQPPAPSRIVDLFDQPGVQHPHETGRDVTVKQRPIRRLDHDAAHRSGEPAATPAGEQLRHRPAAERMHFQRTLDTLRIVRMNTPRRHRIDAGEPLMQRRPSRAVRFALDLRPHHGVRRRQYREAALQRSKVQPRTTREQRDPSRGPNVRNRVHRVVAELGRRIASVRIADVDESMRRAGQHLAAGLARAHVQMPEHHRGVHAHDLEGTALDERRRNPGLAGRGGSHQEYDGTGAATRIGLPIEPACPGIAGPGARREQGRSPPVYGAVATCRDEPRSIIAPPRRRTGCAASPRRRRPPRRRADPRPQRR